MVFLQVLNCKLDEIDDIVDRLSIGCSKPSSALCEADRKCWLRGLYRRDVLSMQLPAIMDFQRGKFVSEIYIYGLA